MENFPAASSFHARLMNFKAQCLIAILAKSGHFLFADGANVCGALYVLFVVVIITIAT